MPEIKTASWFVQLPPGHIRVGISRGVPRGQSGYRRYRALEPGPWFNSVPIAEYLKLYGAILAGLDARKVAAELGAIAGGLIPVMACYEATAKIATGEVWCHRHLAAQWLEDKLGIRVEELGVPRLDRFAKLKAQGIPAPRFE